MRAEHLSLLNFRNYETFEAEFASGKILIVGRNGQGKTNLVEAIAYFDSLRSHRVSADAPLIRMGSMQAVVRLKVAAQKMRTSLELELKQKQAKKAQINGNPVRARELTRYFMSVVFAPEDLLIVRGDPADRRNFLDRAIITRSPYLAGIFSEYDRVLKQRAALLKSGKTTGNFEIVTESLRFWNSQLIDIGTRIMAERRKLVDDLQPYLQIAYKNLAAAEHAPTLEISESISQERYIPKRIDSDFNHLSDVSHETLTVDFAAKLEKMARVEYERGLNLVGPHRDDLFLGLNGLPVKGYASHGESWSMALSLKLAFAQLLRNEFAPEDPVLILDDVFAELDASRRARLMSAVGDYEQVIVTAAVAEDIPISVDWQIFVIAKGQLLAVGKSNDPSNFFKNSVNVNFVADAQNKSLENNQ